MTGFEFLGFRSRGFGDRTGLGLRALDFGFRAQGFGLLGFRGLRLRGLEVWFSRRRARIGLNDIKALY